MEEHRLRHTRMTKSKYLFLYISSEYSLTTCQEVQIQHAYHPLLETCLAYITIENFAGRLDAYGQCSDWKALGNGHGQMKRRKTLDWARSRLESNTKTSCIGFDYALKTSQSLSTFIHLLSIFCSNNRALLPDLCHLLAHMAWGCPSPTKRNADTILNPLHQNDLVLCLRSQAPSIASPQPGFSKYSPTRCQDRITPLSTEPFRLTSLFIAAKVPPPNPHLPSCA